MNINVVKFGSIYAGEHSIHELIKNDSNCSAHFTYSNHVPNGYELVVITYNPTHKTSFFLHSLYGKTKIEALENMYAHVFNLKETFKKPNSPYLNYTIEWYNTNTKQRVKSSFYGKSIQEVISKFFYGKHGKEAEKTPIYSIILNNITSSDMVH